MSAIFITATGTDIGKTFIAAGLIRTLRRLDRAVDARKPLVTGYDPAAAILSDPGTLLAALGRPVNEAEIARISPWRFAAALSPGMAARREDRAIDVDALVQFCRDAAKNYVGTLLIEGIGGVMVPLDDSRTVLDWMSATNIPVLLVTGSYLGSLSHTLTSREALRRRGIRVRLIVVNESPGSPAPLEETVATLQRFDPGVAIVSLPRLSDPAKAHSVFAEIAAML
jgi:dethiobiotin synthetase